MMKNVALAVLALGMPGAALAQDYGHVSPPKPPEPSEPPDVQAPSGPSAVVANRDRVIVSRLRGIQLVGSLGAAATPGQPGIRSDVAFAAPVAPRLQGFIDKPLTLGAVADIERTIIAYYRSRHHPFVSVVTPPQDVTGGVVSVVVTEYSAGDVHVLKNRWFSAANIRAGIRQQSGQPIDAERLLADVGRLNENPFRRVDLVATPGTTPGTTNLDLVVHDRLPLSVYAGYADDGSTATGTQRWKVGLLWGNVFGMGQQFGYQFTASPDAITGRHARPDGSTGPSFMAHAANLSWQLPWRHRLEVFGAYEQDRPNIGPDFAGVGHSGQASVRYIIPFKPTANLAQSLSLGFDYKTTDNNLDFGGLEVSAQSVEAEQFPVTYQATLRDRLGQTTLTDTLVLSPGGLSGRNTDAAFQPGLNQGGVAFARARYAYDRLSVERDTALPHRLTLITSVTVQAASGNLLPSEQLNVGGLETVRGYHEYVVGGSDGVVASGELRSPVFHILPRKDGRGEGDALQADIFLDYAHVRQVRAIPGDPGSAELSSVGVGARYSLGGHMSLRAEAGVPLETPPGQPHQSQFVNFTLTLSR